MKPLCYPPANLIRGKLCVCFCLFCGKVMGRITIGSSCMGRFCHGATYCVVLIVQVTQSRGGGGGGESVRC